MLIFQLNPIINYEWFYQNKGKLENFKNLNFFLYVNNLSRFRPLWCIISCILKFFRNFHSMKGINRKNRLKLLFGLIYPYSN